MKPTPEQLELIQAKYRQGYEEGKAVAEADVEAARTTWFTPPKTMPTGGASTYNKVALRQEVIDLLSPESALARREAAKRGEPNTACHLSLPVLARNPYSIGTEESCGWKDAVADVVAANGGTRYVLMPSAWDRYGIEAGQSMILRRKGKKDREVRAASAYGEHIVMRDGSSHHIEFLAEASGLEIKFYGETYAPAVATS